MSSHTVWGNVVVGRRVALVLAAVMAVTSAKSSAQFGGLLAKSLGMPAMGQAGGAYQANNQIRTYITTGPFDDVDVYGKAIVKAAEMTKDKGFATFGVTKYSCTTTLMGGTPRAKGCYVIAIMLSDGQEAKPRGDRKVQYYKVADVLAGVIARPEG